MKQCIWILIFVTFIFQYGCSGINIIYDNPIYDTIGYDGSNMATNGEHYILNNLILPGMTIFDVGANIGEWSLFALSKQPHSIYSFEPLPLTFENLKNNLYSNKSNTNITLFNMAISNKRSELKFVYYADFDQLSGFYNRPYVENVLKFKPQEIFVKAQDLTSFCQEHAISKINFLKVDTEGAELMVLQGADALLKNKQIDMIQFEYGGTYPDAGITLKQIYDYLTSHEYSIFRIIPNGLLYIPKWRDALETFQYSNYLAISSNSINTIMPHIKA